MKNEERDERLTGDTGDDDIEILEIVGLDEDGEVITFEDDPAPEPASSSTPAESASEDRERLLRLQADFENLKKRSEKEATDNRRYASLAMVDRLLPIIDNFERAIAMEPAPDEDNAFRQGVELIYRQLETCCSDDHPPHTVSKEFLKGYRFQDRLLRPAMVRVNLAPDESSGPEGQAE
jgi:molecular chaperone GrpE